MEPSQLLSFSLGMLTNPKAPKICNNENACPYPAADTKFREVPRHSERVVDQKTHEILLQQIRKRLHFFCTEYPQVNFWALHYIFTGRCGGAPKCGWSHIGESTRSWNNWKFHVKQSKNLIWTTIIQTYFGQVSKNLKKWIFYGHKIIAINFRLY